MYKPQYLPGTIKQGYLTKSPPLEKRGLKGWKKRWCIFSRANGEEPCLNYYRTEEDAFSSLPIKRVNLKHCTKVEMNLSHSNYKNIFAIYLPERTFYFSAPSQIEMTEWSDTLCSHLNLTMLTTTTTLPATPPTPRSAYLDAKGMSLDSGYNLSPRMHHTLPASPLDSVYSSSPRAAHTLPDNVYNSSTSPKSTRALPATPLDNIYSHRPLPKTPNAPLPPRPGDPIRGHSNSPSPSRTTQLVPPSLPSSSSSSSSQLQHPPVPPVPSHSPHSPLMAAQRTTMSPPLLQRPHSPSEPPPPPIPQRPHLTTEPLPPPPPLRGHSAPHSPSEISPRMRSISQRPPAPPPKTDFLEKEREDDDNDGDFLVDAPPTPPPCEDETSSLPPTLPPKTDHPDDVTVNPPPPSEDKQPLPPARPPKADDAAPCEDHLLSMPPPALPPKTPPENRKTSLSAVLSVPVSPSHKAVEPISHLPPPASPSTICLSSSDSEAESPPPLPPRIPVMDTT